jgi:hypothetical protein
MLLDVFGMFDKYENLQKVNFNPLIYPDQMDNKNIKVFDKKKDIKNLKKYYIKA